MLPVSIIHVQQMERFIVTCNKTPSYHHKPLYTQAIYKPSLDQQNNEKMTKKKEEHFINVLLVHTKKHSSCVLRSRLPLCVLQDKRAASKLYK